MRTHALCSPYLLEKRMYLTGGIGSSGHLERKDETENYLSIGLPVLFGLEKQRKLTWMAEREGLQELRWTERVSSM